MICMFFFFNDTATTEIYTLSLHDALPIYPNRPFGPLFDGVDSLGPLGYSATGSGVIFWDIGDRKSTRLNSSHANISYAVFCLKKKKIFALFYTQTIYTPIIPAFYHLPFQF